jgi:hypothetical protein
VDDDEVGLLPIQDREQRDVIGAHATTESIKTTATPMSEPKKKRSIVSLLYYVSKPTLSKNYDP